MRLQTKLALYNTISKVIIILVIGSFLPSFVSQVSVYHIDNRLLAKREKVLKIIERGDIKEIRDDENCSFGNYTLLKEEFISITPVQKLNDTMFYQTDKRNVGGEVYFFRILSSVFKYDKQLYLLEIGEGLDKVSSLNKTLKNLTLWLILMVSVITLFFDIAFTRYLLRPLKKIIREKLKTIRHPNQYSFVPIKTNTDDFKTLDNSIDEMMSKVRDAFLVEKEFIGNVSHELLTPITILQTRFENILFETKLEPEVEQKLLESLKTLARLRKIIKTLLLISNIENDQYLKEDSVDLQPFIREVANEISDRFTDKNITLTYEWQSDFKVDRCNKSLLFTLFFNLLNNAVKYNHIGGKINIKGARMGGKFVVSVEDTGNGMEETRMNDIFNRFKRFKSINNESYGLGLPIVKTIAEFHNLHISVASTPGKGSTFSVAFP